MAARREGGDDSSFTYDRDKGTVKLDLQGSVYGASIEDFPEVMSKVIDALRSVEDVRNIILVQEREYEYPQDQVEMLEELADVLEKIRRDKILSPSNLSVEGCDRHISDRSSFLQDIVVNKLRGDPIGAYVEIKRAIEENKVAASQASGTERECYTHYVKNALIPIRNQLKETKVIKEVKEDLPGHHVGDRDIYRDLFHPTIRPHFMLTRYSTEIPEEGEELDEYKIEETNTEVRIFRLPGEVELLYHAIPPEFNLEETEYTVLDTARRYMSEHEPTESEFADPERTREIFYNIGEDMLQDISSEQDVDIDPDTIEQLASILTRYTAGLGILEILLSDPKVQDVYVNSPVGNSPIYLVHADYGPCRTNFVPTHDEAESWATRFRMKSGRPLDEANPVLDTDANVPGGRARVAIITRTLSPEGLAFAFRRHRSKPWTYPLFINNDMLNPLAAGLMSFIIDGARTMLIAGTRSAGKTSLLSASLTELMKKYRIVTVEDTLELPVPSLEDLGYNIERMKSRSVITQVENELPAEEAIRTSLRLGDSVLIVGEVRSEEARALYEAMRVGALANFVGGTIHGEDAYSVYDRVVNDLNVPKTSFKATDIIVSCNRISSPSGLESYRRVTGITEIRKEWSEDPLDEGAFVELMYYDAEKDQLVPTDTLKNGESVVLSRIANRVREWKNDWEAVWDNIQMRKKIKEALVEFGNKKGRKYLEAPFVVKANDQFHLKSEAVKKEVGALDPEEIYSRWQQWLDSQA